MFDVRHFIVVVLLALTATMPTVHAAACSLTDGSKANDEACSCGSEECTASTGLICYSDVGGGSCRKHNVGAYGYPVAYSGWCNDLGGRKSILDNAACEEAAASLGLSDTTVEEVSFTSRPTFEK